MQFPKKVQQSVAVQDQVRTASIALYVAVLAYQQCGGLGPHIAAICS